MKVELQEILFQKYPAIFKQRNYSIMESCMPWGIDTGPGWYNLIDTLCKLIWHYVHDHPDASVKAVQVKEKYGGLRFYIQGGDDYIYGLIGFAEEMSYRICERCGSTDGVTQTKGWVYTLCRQCLFDRDMAQYGGEDD